MQSVRELLAVLAFHRQTLRAGYIVAELHPTEQMSLQLKELKRNNSIIATIIFVSLFLVYWFSPVHQITDSSYSMLLSQSLLEHRSFALDHYNIPRLTPEYHDHTWKNGHIHQLELVGKNLYYYMPPGSSVLSVPFVAIANAVGVSTHYPDGTYNAAGERKIQLALAALLTSAFAVVVFFAARLLLSIGWSLVVAFGAGLGTQIWSTTSRALWADTWGIFLLGLVVYLLLADDLGQRRLNAISLASLLSWTYFVRPSNAAVVVAVSCYILIKRRELFWKYALTGAVWIALFVTYSWIHYQAVLPTYFRINKRLTFAHFPTAVAGNLISPSRGLFLFVPVTLFVLVIAWLFRKALASRPLLYLATSVLVLNVLVVSTFDPWWAGASFGPRYLAPLVPWFVLLAILGLDALRRAPKGRRRAYALGAGSFLLLVSVAINGLGAWSRRTWTWNGVGNIDHDPHKVWSLKYPQLLAAFTNPPLPASFPAAKQKIELSSTEAEKYLWYGWSGAEQGFRWTEGNEATVIFSIEKPQDVTLRMCLTPFVVSRKHESQQVEVVLNAVPIEKLVLTGDRPIVYEFRLMSTAVRERNILTLRLPDAASPSDFDLNADERRLGLAVQWIGFSTE